MPSGHYASSFELAPLALVSEVAWACAEVARAAWTLFQQHLGKGLPVSAVIYSHSHVDHWGGVRGLVNEADVTRRFYDPCTREQSINLREDGSSLVKSRFLLSTFQKN